MLVTHRFVVEVCNMRGCKVRMVNIVMPLNGTVPYLHLEKGFGSVRIITSLEIIQQSVKEDDYLLLGMINFANVTFTCHAQEGCAYSVKDNNRAPSIHIPFLAEKSTIFNFPLPSSGSLSYWREFRGVEGAALPTFFVGYDGAYQLFTVSPTELEVAVDAEFLSVDGYAEQAMNASLTMAIQTSSFVYDLNAEYSIKSHVL